jgi:hypothetical protein
MMCLEALEDNIGSIRKNEEKIIGVLIKCLIMNRTEDIRQNKEPRPAIIWTSDDELL